MTFTGNEAGTRAPAYTSSHLDSAYVDWASIIGGALVAVAIFTTLMVFGSAIGLSLTSADPTQGLSAKVAAVAVGLWAAWVAASSFAAGGFIAGRLRHRIADATVPEVEMRDGLHGLIAWALAAMLSAILLASAIGTPAEVASKEAAATTQQAQVAKLFRGEHPADRSERQVGRDGVAEDDQRAPDAGHRRSPPAEPDGRREDRYLGGRGGIPRADRDGRDPRFRRQHAQGLGAGGLPRGGVVGRRRWGGLGRGCSRRQAP